MNQVRERFKFSFGGWCVLASLLKPLEFLLLQGLSKYQYRVGVSRAQTRW